MPRRLPDEVFERVLRRVARGERRNAICAEPGQPSITAIHKHRKRNPGFAARWNEALGRRQGARVQAFDLGRVLDRVGRGERLKTVCAEPGMPSAAAVIRARRANPDAEGQWVEAFGKRRGASAAKDPMRLAAYLDAARSGQETRSLGRLIDWKAVRRLRERDPFFAARFADARSAGAVIVTRRATASTLSPTEIYAVVESAVRRVHPAARDDVRSDLIMEMLEGKVAPEDARAAAGRLTTAWNRIFGRRDISMDQEMFDDGPGTFGGFFMDPASYVPDGVEVIRPAW